MVLMPKGPGGQRGGHLNVDAEAVTQQSENKDIAYEFIKYLTDYEAQLGIVQEIGLVSRPAVYDDPLVKDHPLIRLLGQATEEATEHRGVKNLRKQELQDTVKAILDPLWSGDVQPDEAFFAEASEEFQLFLDKPQD